MHVPFDTAILPKTSLGRNAVEHVSQVLDSLRIAKSVASENMRIVQEKMKQRYDSRAKESPYDEGDLVWITNPVTVKKRSPKLEPKYKGPYIISRKCSNDTYQLRNRETLKELPSRTHANRLKPFYEAKKCMSPLTLPFYQKRRWVGMQWNMFRRCWIACELLSQWLQKI